MTAECDALSRAKTITVAAIEEFIPQLVEARDIALDAWLEKVRQSLVNAFACGMIRDIDAVRAPIAPNRSEGKITKLKLVKRQMYARAKLDLLEARLIAAAT